MFQTSEPNKRQSASSRAKSEHYSLALGLDLKVAAPSFTPERSATDCPFDKLSALPSLGWSSLHLATLKLRKFWVADLPRPARRFFVFHHFEFQAVFASTL